MNLDSPRWTSAEDEKLKVRYNDSYDILEKEFNRSKRALKHRIGFLGLKRDERRRWSVDEREVLRKYKALTAKELIDKGLIIGRSEVSIMLEKNKELGTARKIPEIYESEECAWLLGAIFSDGHVRDYQLSFSQKQEDSEFILKVKDVLEDMGMKVNVKKIPGENYIRLWSCSKFYKDILGKQSWKPITLLNKIDNDYKWVKNDKYVWWFLGGVIDGDGYVGVGKVGNSNDYARCSFAIKGVEEKKWFIELLKSLDVDSYGRDKDFSLEIRGGDEKVRSFVNKIKTILKRKSFEKIEYGDGIKKIPYRLAKRIMLEKHYLGSLPVGTINYGLFESGLKGVASLGWANKSKLTEGKRVLELKRFVLINNEHNLASRFLGALIKELKKESVCDIVVSYADMDFHTGTIYKAAGFKEVGETGEMPVFITDDGNRFSGRYVVDTMRRQGYDIEDAKIEIGKGKKKFVKYLK